MEWSEVRSMYPVCLASHLPTMASFWDLYMNIVVAFFVGIDVDEECGVLAFLVSFVLESLKEANLTQSLHYTANNKKRSTSFDLRGLVVLYPFDFLSYLLHFTSLHFTSILHWLQFLRSEYLCVGPVHLCIYVCMYVCMYVYVCMYISYIYIAIYVCISRDIYLYTYIYIYIYIYKLCI